MKRSLCLLVMSAAAVFGAEGTQAKASWGTVRVVENSQQVVSDPDLGWRVKLGYSMLISTDRTDVRAFLIKAYYWDFNSQWRVYTTFKDTFMERLRNGTYPVMLPVDGTLAQVTVTPLYERPDSEQLTVAQAK